MQRTPVPQPPADLPERIMQRIRAEAALAQASVATDEREADELSSLATEPGAAPARTWRELVDRALDPRHRRALVAWSAAAAVIFIAAGFGAIAGVRTILVPPRMAQVEITADSGAPAGPGELPGTVPLERPAGEEAGAGAEQTAGPSLVTFGSNVYRLVGPAADDPDTLDEIGTTRSALDTGGSPDTLEVLGTGDPGRIYVSDGERLLTFERLTRTYEGRLYVLQSGSLTAFGQWPTLPPGLETPTSADGSPAFEQDGTDEAGTAVFRAKGSDAEEGIAVAPNPPFPDAMASSPVWTWWTVAE